MTTSSPATLTCSQRYGGTCDRPVAEATHRTGIGCRFHGTRGNGAPTPIPTHGAAAAVAAGLVPSGRLTYLDTAESPYLFNQWVEQTLNDHREAAGAWRTLVEQARDAGLDGRDDDAQTLQEEADELRAQWQPTGHQARCSGATLLLHGSPNVSLEVEFDETGWGEAWVHGEWGGLASEDHELSPAADQDLVAFLDGCLYNEVYDPDERRANCSGCEECFQVCDWCGVELGYDPDRDAGDLRCPSCAVG